jgi:hypothetical protein
MKDSSPMNEARYEIIAGNTINPKNKGGRSTIGRMRKNFRSIYNDPRAMIEARKRAASQNA